jgi:uncharacterized protein (TIGR03083 family)
MTQSEYATLVDLVDEVYEATTQVVSGLDDDAFGRPTRTELWSVKDLLFHQMCDAQRALIVFTTSHPGPAETDAVSYWSRWAPGGPGADDHARYASKAATAYGSPSSLVAQWTETSRAAVRAARAHDGAALVTTQGHVLTAADFTHTLAVEGVVHHLDLTLEQPSPDLSPDAYQLVLDVLTGLLGAELPPSWSRTEAILKGTGREPLDDADRMALGDSADRLPLFG